MDRLKIERIIGKRKVMITLDEDEMERAYRIMERRYLDEDFVNALADAVQESDTRFHIGHLEEFPELLNWLCVYFDDIYDASIGHNDLIALALDHLNNASLDPQFFQSLSGSVRVMGMDMGKHVTDCELGYTPSDADIDGRSRQWMTLASLTLLHKNGNCTCSMIGKYKKCPAAKYLKGEWDISEFFHLEDRRTMA